MKFIEKPVGQFIDRTDVQSQIESIDVVMATLDAENFLERSLYSVYREIPVRKLIVCDGGSNDNTLKIFKKFPRVEIFIKPEIRSGGKVVEFLISKVETDWFAFIDSDIFLEEGWYDNMKKYQNNYDVIENSKTVLAYHFFREFSEKMKKYSRPSHFCHLVKKEATQNYHCEDDDMFRFTDYLFIQSIEKSGYKYGKNDTTQHVHNETERIPYESDSDKNFIKVVMKEPEKIILNDQKNKEMIVKNAKSIVKYLDPEYLPVKKNRGIDSLIKLLDRKWIEKNGPQWLERYTKATSPSFSFKYSLKKAFLKIRGKNS